MFLSRHAVRVRAGFTILELMISVAIIGLLAAIAIPNFLTYQATSRRSEAFANVKAIATLETTYYGENDEYFPVLASMPDWPTVKPSGLLDAEKMRWDAASEAAFSGLGWAPEGGVYHSYDVNTDCNGEPAFTVTAYGDVDANGQTSGIQFGKADRDGLMCEAVLNVFVGFPLRAEEVVVYDTLDRF